MLTCLRFSAVQLTFLSGLGWHGGAVELLLAPRVGRVVTTATGLLLITCPNPVIPDRQTGLASSPNDINTDHNLQSNLLSHHHSQSSPGCLRQLPEMASEPGDKRLAKPSSYTIPVSTGHEDLLHGVAYGQ